MVDFRRRLAKKQAGKIVDPLALYGTLDRASDKGELRRAQEAILAAWYGQFRSKRDVILKLHTGQGKTLIGLLVLLSRLNEHGGPALYLCLNNFLVAQTCEQARQFGIRYCTADPDLPADFLDGKSILITSVHKLFNGLTRFGLGSQSVAVDSIVIDDAHACIEDIREQFTISLSREDPAYAELLNLFSATLEDQGAGTLADIRHESYDALLSIPYWDWRDKRTEVLAILSSHSTDDAIRFTWPLLRDQLPDCQCVISGANLEIAPYLPPLDLFGSYHNARHRVFMSATVTDDAFLVKGLRLSPDTIRSPLVYEKERWSGEKMILLPSLIPPGLTRDLIVNTYGVARPNRPFGVVVLVPSMVHAKGWQARGATLGTRATIEREIAALKGGAYETPLVIANRYDGIDLPDASCRLLILDSKPYAQSLVDRYAERSRSSSEITAIRLARTIEQGLGRSVRGEKDYCVILLIGEELVKTVRAAASRRHLSAQTRTQIEMGLEIAQMAQEDDRDTPPLDILRGLINKCLSRDEDWKAFYVEYMDSLHPADTTSMALDIFQLELEAELAFHSRDPQRAIELTQRLIDTLIKDDTDKGWYLQEMARYAYVRSKSESNQLQIGAHKKNRFLLKPRDGMTIDKLVVSQQRVEKIIAWVRGYSDYAELNLHVEDILARLRFGVAADSFERALDELGRSLGFECQRPDKEWKRGPDNLWGLREGEYLIIECKSEAHPDKKEVSKHEAGQMNTSCAWFAQNYKGAKAKKIMITPAGKLAADAAFTDDVEVMRSQELGKLVSNVRAFFAEFASLDLRDLSSKHVQELLQTHGLSVEQLLKGYSKPPRGATGT